MNMDLIPSFLSSPYKLKPILCTTTFTTNGCHPPIYTTTFHPFKPCWSRSPLSNTSHLYCRRTRKAPEFGRCCRSP
ncbi:hypothetical protein HanIR_Chr01g0027481 [Helianthus annuus]|nr:hypothetical protein HanIR_Chr01g0027481 [Helianthus annuus]